MATTTDRHRSAFLVRIPEEYRPVLEALWELLGQSSPEAVRRALDDYATKHGIKPPAEFAHGRRTRKPATRR